MDLVALKFVAIGFCVFGFLGCALALGNMFSNAISSIARNPSAEGKLSKYIYIGAGFIESMGLFSLIIALILIFVI